MALITYGIVAIPFLGQPIPETLLTGLSATIVGAFLTYALKSAFEKHSLNKNKVRLDADGNVVAIGGAENTGDF